MTRQSYLVFFSLALLMYLVRDKGGTWSLRVLICNTLTWQNGHASDGSYQGVFQNVKRKGLFGYSISTQPTFMQINLILNLLYEVEN